MNIPFNTNSKESFEDKINNNRNDIESEKDKIDRTINFIDNRLRNDFRDVIDTNNHVSDRLILNINRRIGSYHDSVAEYVKEYIEKQDNIKDKNTEKAKIELSREYMQFFEDLIRELENCKEELEHKIDTIDQIEYKKQRLENSGENPSKNDFDIPDFENEVDQKISKIKDKNSDENKNDPMMTIEDFVLFVVMEIKRNNDLDYSRDDYKVYRSTYPEKTDIIRRNISNEDLNYLCADINSLPPLTGSQIKTLKIIRRMIQDGNLDDVDKYTKEIISN